jgi:FkbM family methyltransferase
MNSKSAPNPQPTSCELEPAPLWANALGHISRRLPAGRYHIVEWVRRTRAKPFLARLPKELGGYRFQCSIHDNIGSQVFFAGCYEAQESAFARAILGPAMSFVDVGAHWGFFSLMAAHLVGSTGRILSLEPDPRAFLRLKANIERNQLVQVTVFELAAADRDANWTLALQNETVLHLGTSRFVQNGGAAASTRIVRSRPLDLLLDEARLDGVNLVKIDVEGAEDLVLAGMEEGLRRRRYHSMILELHPPHLADRKRTIAEVLSVLRGLGYKGFGLDHSPAAERRSAYHPRLHVREFIVPLEEALATPWPHTVWLSPGQAELI